METYVGVIVVAAGHGTLRPGVSKLTETVDVACGTSMLGQVLRTVNRVKGLWPRWLVLNGRFRHQIDAALERDRVGGYAIMHQHRRRGAADAVRLVMEHDRTARQGDAFLVVYGDMPLWRTETLRRLVEMHQSSTATHLPRPMISMVTVKIGGADSPRILERYGRVFRDARGRIVNVVEPGDARAADLVTTTSVNPSLYVFDRAWFLSHYDRIRPYPRADGHGDEFHLPPLLAVAAEEEATVAELVLTDPEEALGVNIPAELADVQAIVSRRSTAGQKTTAE
ncbi:hypothetical protein EPO33_03905 [Patescibacteria group bacterium]|nr:MAG: hypothetical protein EPO33_03905 [Patescibacteria group bacterium]